MASGHGQGSMSLSMKLIRLLIVLLNLVFVVVGIVLLAIGIYVVKDPKIQQLRPLLNPDMTSAYSQSMSNIEIFAVAIIVIGGVLLAIGFLGCCGSIKGFRFLHAIYAAVITVIIIVEIVVVIVFVAYQNRVRTELVPKLQDSIATFYVGTPTSNNSVVNPVSLSWDFAQFNLQCCGAVNASDFDRAKNWTRANPYEGNSTNLLVPFTCCPLGATKSWTELPDDMSEADTCAKTASTAYTIGCYDRLVDIVVAYKNNVIIGLIIVGVVEILALISAVALYRRNEDYNSL